MTSVVKTRGANVVLRVELLGIEPLIWRRVRVASSTRLKQLHDVLQLVMGWQDMHLHEFLVGEFLIGMMDIDDPPENLQDENAWSLEQVLKTGVSEFEYHYDFGDDWLHRLIVEPAGRGRAGGSGPLCLAGENACPPEDVGGPPGYAEFLRALSDAKHERQDCTDAKKVNIPRIFWQDARKCDTRNCGTRLDWRRWLGRRCFLPWRARWFWWRLDNCLFGTNGRRRGAQAFLFHQNRALHFGRRRKTLRRFFRERAQNNRLHSGRNAGSQAAWRRWLLV